MRPFTFLILLSIGISDDPIVELPIGLTEDEMLRVHEIYSMGRETDPPPTPVRNVAEYERMQGVLIRYPFGISTEMISEMSEDVTVYCLVSSSQQSSAFNALENGGVNLDNVEFVIGSTDSYWTRDYGPWWVVDGDRNMAVVDFTYNRPRLNDNDAPLKMSNHLEVPFYASDIVHTGGNYMTDGLGISASTDIVYTENSIPDEDVDSLMHGYYGIETYHVVDDPNNTYIDHIDCWGKYLSTTKVLIREVPESHPQYDEIEEAAEYFSNSLNKWGEPWELFRVWTPGNQPYTNSLILNEKIFVPITGGSWDDEALTVYENAFPGYEVLGFSGSWESTDALHCRTKGIPDLQMLQIIHNPLNDGSEPDINGYSLDALFDDLSGTGLIEDSMKVFWKTPGAETWDSNTLSRSSAPEEQNVWTGSIPAIVDSGLIQYFVQGADSSGRIEKSPLAGWHTFFAHPTEACDEWLIGDLDNSGELNIIDILLLSEIVNNNSFGLCPQSISDINNDDQTTVVDIVFLVNIVLNP
ncbi:MAG: peptidylarginine deiminase [bacterium TMED46]|nr:MAG: peptidylarginine deiminase [bacterium TMED46]